MTSAGESGPAVRHAPPSSPSTTSSRLLTAVTALATASNEREVATILVQHAAQVTDARGAALVVPVPGREAGEIVASVGYDCDTMGAGARLPYSAGLPVTEALRTGRDQVVGGTGTTPGWVALTLGPTGSPLGAIVLSLQPDSRWTATETQFVRSLVRTGARTLLRAQSRSEALRAATALAGSLRPGTAPRVPGLDVAVRLLPLDQALGIGGDIAEVTPDGSGGWWLVVADACGSGADAAPRAGSVRTAVRALGRHVRSPAELLGEIDQLLHDERSGDDLFVTACALHLQVDGDVVRVRSASAGHPLPLVRSADGLLRTIGRPGFLLGVEPDVSRQDSADELTAGEVLVVHSDGLTDVPSAPADAWPLHSALTAADPTAAADATADAVLRSVLAGRGQADDVALVVVRPQPVSPA